MTSNDVRGVRLWDENCNLETFPANIENFFPNILALWLNDCRLTEVSSQNFENLANLVEVDLAFNRLQYVHENLLENSKDLQFLYLNDNRIAFIGPNLLQPLKTLTYASVENNLCISAKFFDNLSNESKSELRNLVIDIAIHCPLTIHIAAGIFGAGMEKNKHAGVFEKSQRKQEEVKSHIRSALK